MENWIHFLGEEEHSLRELSEGKEMATNSARVQNRKFDVYPKSKDESRNVQ